MSPRIHILSPELADQIAAGEVVERPASVVKELCENSLDAGARRIDVLIEAGGLDLISVRDDGHGMSPDDAPLALRRYATSKLKRIEDLFALSTMGFRGEALPSIAAVSRLSLTSRAQDAESGVEVVSEGGVVSDPRVVGAPIGTRIEVRRLLHNVPARLKFMKSATTETAHVIDAVMRLALPFFNVHFTLRHDERVLLDLPPHRSLAERAHEALAQRTRGDVALHAAEGTDVGVTVQAYLGSPALSSNTTRSTLFFVNRRFVRDRSLLQALHLGYDHLIERGRYPMAVVHLTVQPDQVDINVHPQKLEVRFARPHDVTTAIRHVVSGKVASAPWLHEGAGRALQSYSVAPLAARAPSMPYVGAPRSEKLGFFSRVPSLFERAQSGMLALDAPEPFFDDTRPLSASGKTEKFFSPLIYIGQLSATYLLCEAPGELVLIDQHAAHERVQFERLRKNTGALPAQRLLVPLIVELGPEEKEVVEESTSVLTHLGFTLVNNGAQTQVTSVPQFLAAKISERLFKDLLTELSQFGTARVVEERVAHLLATMACHSAVRAGDLLGYEEVRALLSSMDEIDMAAHCPHGRPVLVRISMSELERRFGRT